MYVKEKLFEEIISNRNVHEYQIFLSMCVSNIQTTLFFDNQNKLLMADDSQKILVTVDERKTPSHPH